MSSAALRDVTEAIRDRVAAAIGAAAVHVGPLDDEGAREARMALFLYRLSVNADLRSAGHRRVSPNPGVRVVLLEDAVPFDLYYLLTASPKSDNNDLEGLLDLGLALQALNDRPELVGGALAGDTVRLSLEAMTTEEMGRVWALFPAANYRTSVTILATPVWIDPAQLRPQPHPVVHEKYLFSQTFPEVRNGA